MPDFSMEFWVGTVVAVITLLVGLGATLAMDAKTKGEFRFSVTCFLVSALTMVYGIVEWDMKTNWPTLPRMLIVYVIVAFVVLITGETIRWANGRHTHAAASHSGPTGTTPTAKDTDKGDKDTSRWADGKPAIAEQPKPKPIPSTEPADRANLHVIGVKFEAPDIDKLESLSKLQPDVFSLAQAIIPRPKASILIRNIGKYRVSNYVIRTAIILSEPLAPGEEDKLFAHRSEWQSGGAIGTGNVWYPGDEKIIHTTWNQNFQQSDWSDLIAGNKVFYIVTKSTFQDQIGSLPATESCRWVSLKDHKQTSGLCLAHNT
jgi:Ca2+/Na+ antiporter